MVKHLVFFKLKETAHGNPKAVNAQLIKDKLEGLRGLVPGIIALEVGLDFSRSETSADVALYSEFSTRAALDAYMEHPRHKEVASFIGEARTERRVVDYEI